MPARIFSGEPDNGLRRSWYLEGTAICRAALAANSSRAEGASRALHPRRINASPYAAVRITMITRINKIAFQGFISSLPPRYRPDSQKERDAKRVRTVKR